MRYFKSISDGYIYTIGQGNGGIEITEAEYSEIKGLIATRPAETELIGYRLKTDLTWEQYEKDPPEPPEPTDSDKAEAYDILMGVSE